MEEEDKFYNDPLGRIDLTGIVPPDDMSQTVYLEEEQIKRSGFPCLEE